MLFRSRTQPAKFVARHNVASQRVARMVREAAALRRPTAAIGIGRVTLILHRGSPGFLPCPSEDRIVTGSQRNSETFAATLLPLVPAPAYYRQDLIPDSPVSTWLVDRLTTLRQTIKFIPGPFHRNYFDSMTKSGGQSYEDFIRSPRPSIPKNLARSAGRSR